MEESLVIKKLLNVDMELHSLIAGLRIKKHNLSLSELNKLMEEDRILDVDSTELIRQMRGKEYDL